MGLTFKTSKSHSGPDYTKTWLILLLLGVDMYCKSHGWIQPVSDAKTWRQNFYLILP